MKPSCQACAGTAMRRRIASAVAGTAVAGTMCGDSQSGHGGSHVQRRQGQPCASGRRGSNERGHGGSHVPVVGTASRCRTATTARPRRVGPAPVAAAARARRYGLRCAGAACAKWLWIARCAAARRSPRCCWSWCCSMPNPRFATGLARLRVRRATREARPRSRPNRPLLHCRPKRRGNGESGTNRREDYRADGDGGDLGSEKVRDVHSVPPIRRPAGRHAMRRPYGVTAPRCRRLGRSARRRWRTR